MFRHPSILLTLWLIPLTVCINAQVAACYDIVGPADNEQLTPNLDSLLGSQLLISRKAIAIDTQLATIEHSETKYFSEREALLKFYSCLYKFPSLPKYGTFRIDIYSMVNQNIGNEFHIINFGQDTSAQHILFARGHFFNLLPCGLDGQCMESQYINSRTTQISKVFNVEPDSSVYAYYPGHQEIKTETVLVKEASNKITVTPARVKKVETVVHTGEICTCAGYTPEYDTLYRQIIVKDEIQHVTVDTAIFERVTEIALVKEATLQIDTIAIANRMVIDSPLVIIPEHKIWNLEAVDTSCISINPFDCLQWNWHTISEKSENLTFYDQVCPDGYTAMGLQCIRELEIPAEYEQRWFYRLSVPASTQITVVPAEYKSYEYQYILNRDDIPDTCIDSTFHIIHRVKIIQPTTVNAEEVPAEYESRSYHKTVAIPRIEQVISNPGKTKRIIQTKIVEAGCSTEINPVVCDLFLTPALIGEIHQTLIDKGYSNGPLSNEMTALFHAGIINYQLIHNLPIGRIDDNIMRSLGINY